ncbi:MAG: hypothetical protein SangKO_013220 [Sandaracinaceae bacterium]
MMSRLLVCLSIFAVACGSNESDAPPTPPPAEPSVEPAAQTAEQGTAEQGTAAQGTEAPETTPAAEGASAPAIGALVRRGRVHFRERRFAEAAAEFDRALARNPGDGALSCETGWAFHHAGDDDKARRLLQHGTRLLASRSDQTRAYGACLYNLGRMAEDAGQADAAARLYGSSLRARPNRVVQQRLDALEVEASAERPLYGTVEAAIETSEGLDGVDPRDLEAYYIQDLESVTAELPARAPVLEVATVSYGDGGAWRCRYWRLTARVEAGWVTPVELGDACGATESDGYDDGSFTVRSMAWIEGAPSPTVAVHVVNSYQRCEYGEEDGDEDTCTSSSDEALRVYRYGGRALEPLFELPLVHREREDDDVTSAYASEHELLPDGQILVRATEGSPPPWMLGTHSVDELTTAAERHAATSH